MHTGSVSATGTYAATATLSPSIVGGYTAIIGTYKMAGGAPVTVTAPVATGEVREAGSGTASGTAPRAA